MFDQKITYKIVTSESKSKFDLVLTTYNIFTCYLCTKNYVYKLKSTNYSVNKINKTINNKIAMQILNQKTLYSKILNVLQFLKT